MIFIAGIAISIFLTALLLVKRNKSIADKFLLAWFAIIALHQIFYYYYASGAFLNNPAFIGYDMSFPLLHGPFLFLYASALVDRLPRNRFLILIHFIPAVLCYPFILDFFLDSAEQRIYVMTHKGVGYETFVNIRQIAIILSGIGYVVATLLLLRKHQKKILDKFSSIEKINLKWLQYLTYGIAFIWIPVIFSTDEYVFLSVVLFVAFIGFFGIKQTPIFVSNNHHIPPGDPKDFESYPEIVMEDDESSRHNSISDKILSENGYSINAMSNVQNETLQKKYETSGLSPDKKKEIATDLKNHIDDEKLYTNPDLSLDVLADTLKIHPNYLSQFINEELSLTFYDYINSKRVNEFKSRVNRPENNHFSMLGLALECGFNSKSSFNRNFKKFAGITPSEYVRQFTTQAV